MKKILATLMTIALLSPLSVFAINRPTLPAYLGETGTTSAPAYGEVLVGNGNGGYTAIATSSLGIVSGGGSNPWSESYDAGTFDLFNIGKIGNRRIIQLFNATTTSGVIVTLDTNGDTDWLGSANLVAQDTEVANSFLFTRLSDGRIYIDKLTP